MGAQLYLLIFDFLILALVSYIVRYRFMRDGLSTTAAGSIVMALSTFGLGVLPQFSPRIFSCARYMALETLIVWVFLVASYMQCYVQHYFHIHERLLLNRFNRGTWVASCALLAILLKKTFPEWYEIYWLVGLLAILQWVPYIRQASEDMWYIYKSQLVLQLNGSIFLVTISTASLVFLMHTLFPNMIPFSISFSLLILGYVFFILCLFFLIRNYLHMRLRNILLEWNHSNTLIYGSLATLGLVGTFTHILPEIALVITWWLTAAAFIVVEILSGGRLYIRICKKNISRVVGGYDVTQWSRASSCSVFYFFSVVLLSYPDSVAQLKLHDLLNMIVAYGQYFMLVLLVGEIGLFFRAKLRCCSLSRVSSFQ